MPEKPENSVGEKAENQNLQAEVRELTLTDRLNKRLLTSFLERINTTDTFNQSTPASTSVSYTHLDVYKRQMYG